MGRVVSSIPVGRVTTVNSKKTRCMDLARMSGQPVKSTKALSSKTYKMARGGKHTPQVPCIPGSGRRVARSAKSSLSGRMAAPTSAKWLIT